jgi:hypothetical protein
MKFLYFLINAWRRYLEDRRASSTNIVQQYAAIWRVKP